jgi:hypothetical protein
MFGGFGFPKMEEGGPNALYDALFPDGRSIPPNWERFDKVAKSPQAQKLINAPGNSGWTILQYLAISVRFSFLECAFAESSISSLNFVFAESATVTKKYTCVI